jgi:uncharacterized protein DUF4167
MRQGQQNRRGRGRGRKPQNPLARNYESNGPDVKIRGTAAHIAEKYMSLARDALASGDMIAAESYFQHAEHYNRIIMAAQSQFGPQHGGQPGEGGNGGYRPRWNADGSEDDGGSDSTDGGGGDVRETHDGSGHDRERQGGGGQDRERHTGNREHHGGRDQYQRRGPNGSEGQGRDTNGSESADAAQSDESASDPVG